MIVLGSIVSWLAVVLGAMRMAMGYFIASQNEAETRVAMAARYLGSKTSGEAIDQGLFVFIFGVTLGVLVQIARGVRR
jgi:hypothetical protein